MAQSRPDLSSIGRPGAHSCLSVDFLSQSICITGRAPSVIFALRPLKGHATIKRIGCLPSLPFLCDRISRRNTVDAVVVRRSGSLFRNLHPKAQRDYKQISGQTVKARSIVKCVLISLTTVKLSRS
jgi:hypothetical protein